MSSKVIQPPSCLGSATTLNLNSQSVCRGCEHLVACGTEVIGKLTMMSKSIPIADILVNLRTQFESVVGTDSLAISEPVLALTGSAPERSIGRLKRRELTERETKLLDKMPIKVAKRMRPLMRAGIFGQIKPDIVAGRNPFPVYENHFLHTFADLLIRQRKVVKSKMAVVFAQQYGWTPATAASHVSVAIAVFMILELTVDQGDKIELKDADAI